MYPDITIENGRAAKKNTEVMLTKGNHANFLRILFTRAEDTILALLAHTGDQELFPGKLAVKSFDFTAAGHADMLLRHPRSCIPGQALYQDSCSIHTYSYGSLFLVDILALGKYLKITE
jgi:hypothetical protein